MGTTGVRYALRLARHSPFFTLVVLITASISLPAAAYASPEQRGAFYRNSLARVAALPGVSAVGLATALPLDGNVGTIRIGVEGRASPAQAIRASRTAIAGSYFRTLGLPLQAGEWFGEHEAASVAVNQALVRALWTSEARAVGARIRMDDGPWLRVAGVVGDARQILTVPAAPQVYLPLHLESPAIVSFIARTDTPPMALAEALRGAVRDLDVDVAMGNAQTMEDIIDGYLPAPLLAAFGGVALAGLFFAALGLYAVIAFQVTRRTREFGIRMAVGADPRAVLRLVLFEGLRITGVGLLLGATLGLWLGYLLAHRLFPIRVGDPVVAGVVAGALVAVSVAASLVPAGRATRIEPAVALRRE